MQKITLIGNLGRDAEIKEAASGNKFLTMTVAAHGVARGNEKKTTWYDVTTFNFSEKMVPYLTKGSSIIVIGELDAGVELGKDGRTRCVLRVTADSIDFNSTGNSGSTQTQQTVVENTAKPATSVEDEEIITTGKVPTQVKQQAAPAVEDNSDNDLPF